MFFFVCTMFGGCFVVIHSRYQSTNKDINYTLPINTDVTKSTNMLTSITPIHFFTERAIGALNFWRNESRHSASRRTYTPPCWWY